MKDFNSFEVRELELVAALVVEVPFVVVLLLSSFFETANAE
jgi:hypothetical protein